ncbi:MAG: hypothetical protein NWE83_09710 [Candidatus Bathyarchaeota archaeon]|nr:hypothetical protein [Candidatus Bathyarchaeota archaeon]
MTDIVVPIVPWKASIQRPLSSSLRLFHDERISLKNRVILAITILSRWFTWRMRGRQYLIGRFLE